MRDVELGHPCQGLTEGSIGRQRWSRLPREIAGPSVVRSLQAGADELQIRYEDRLGVLPSLKHRGMDSMRDHGSRERRQVVVGTARENLGAHDVANCDVVKGSGALSFVCGHSQTVRSPQPFGLRAKHGRASEYCGFSSGCSRPAWDLDAHRSPQDDARPPGALPGDDLLPFADLTATHAVTIRAPADDVWPWVA